MTHDAGDAANPTYVRLCRSQPDGAVQELVLSRAAMHLHTFGVLSSIEAGTPGFVSDHYLDSIQAETSLPALELTLVGLWERTVFGYRVSDEDTIGVARQLHGQLAGLAARCEADGGHQVRSTDGACSRCGVHAAMLDLGGSGEPTTY